MANVTFTTAIVKLWSGISEEVDEEVAEHLGLTIEHELHRLFETMLYSFSKEQVDEWIGTKFGQFQLGYTDNVRKLTNVTFVELNMGGPLTELVVPYLTIREIFYQYRSFSGNEPNPIEVYTPASVRIAAWYQEQIKASIVKYLEIMKHKSLAYRTQQMDKACSQTNLLSSSSDYYVR